MLLKTSASSNTVWEMKGEQGDKWIQASVEIQAPAQYKVRSLNVNGYCSDDFDENSSFGDACDDKCHDDNGRL